MVDQPAALIDGQVPEPAALALLDQVLPARHLPSRDATVTLDDLGTYAGAILANSIGVVPVGRIGEHRFTGGHCRGADLRDLPRPAGAPGMKDAPCREPRGNLEHQQACRLI